MLIVLMIHRLNTDFMIRQLQCHNLLPGKSHPSRFFRVSRTAGLCALTMERTRQIPCNGAKISAINLTADPFSSSYSHHRAAKPERATSVATAVHREAHDDRPPAGTELGGHGLVGSFLANRH